MFKLICRMGIKPKFCDLKSLGRPKRVRGLINHEIVIQVDLNKVVDYTIIQVRTMVTTVTSYDVLVGGGVDMVYHSWFYLLCVVYVC